MEVLCQITWGSAGGYYLYTDFSHTWYYSGTSDKKSNLPGPLSHSSRSFYTSKKRRTSWLVQIVEKVPLLSGWETNLWQICFSYDDQEIMWVGWMLLAMLTWTGTENLAVDTTVPSEGASANPIVLTGLECMGNESTLSDCSRASSVSQCSHSMDAGARCSKNLCTGGGGGEVSGCWREEHYSSV